MANYQDLLTSIVQPLVDYPDDVRVTVQESEHQLLLELHIHTKDIGKVIGKHGRVIKSIRTVVQAAASAKNEKIWIQVIE
ncbi:KH domain-containing protein [Mangrovibacillus cuniculi]|uniref:RNA-binding protein KhpA n=1 Tax=Mangrovibacillus cuniculi TaxID=2593652 RepID=A0A7S8CAC9_9BACI|nr:KH domain-containing protein [Mangrovibacillus cuniculi]QPC46320.1 KH domain-containing protein [Mangrovibacillus cuniculi]